MTCPHGRLRDDAQITEDLAGGSQYFATFFDEYIIQVLIQQSLFEEEEEESEESEFAAVTKRKNNCSSEVAIGEEARVDMRMDWGKQIESTKAFEVE